MAADHLHNLDTLRSQDLLEGKLPGQDYFITTYKDPSWTPPWDVRKAQPAIVEALEQGLFKGKVLDLGTGTGDNAVYLASKGVKVVASDFSEDALKRAKQRAKAAGHPASENLIFKQADVLDAGALQAAFGGERFDTVLDSALLHCFNDEQQETYARNLEQLVAPKGQVVVLIFSDRNPDPWLGPIRVSRARMQQLFNEAAGWRIESMVDKPYHTNIHKKGYAEAFLSVISRF